MTDDEIKSLQSSILHLSTTIPGSATELAKIAAVAGQLGIRGSKNIMEFTRVTAMMAASTVLNSEEAALAIAKISKAYGLPIREAERMASTINELSNTTAANSKEISAAVLKMATSAHIFGISMQTASAIGATLIDMGMKAERAGTRMKTVFTRMSTEAEKLSELLNRPQSEIRLGLSDDPEGMFNDVVEMLSKYENKQDAITEATSIFGRVGATAVLGLVSNYDALRRNIVAASSEFEKATSLQNEFNIAMSSTTNQWKLFWQGWAADWNEAMTSTNKGFGAWLQQINRTNIALRTSRVIARELAEFRKEQGMTEEKSLNDVFDSGIMQATTKSTASRATKILSLGTYDVSAKLTVDDMESQLEKFREKARERGLGELSQQNVAEWKIRYF